MENNTKRERVFQLRKAARARQHIEDLEWLNGDIPHEPPMNTFARFGAFDDSKFRDPIEQNRRWNEEEFWNVLSDSFKNEVWGKDAGFSVRTPGEIRPLYEAAGSPQDVIVEIGKRFEKLRCSFYKNEKTAQTVLDACKLIFAELKTKLSK